MTFLRSTRSRRLAVVGALSAALLILLLAAPRERRTFVDGYAIGDRACADAESNAQLNVHGRPWCGTFTAFASRTLDEAVPGHAPVVSLDLYRPDYPGKILMTRSGGYDLIAVLGLADGAVHAFYIGCGVGAANERCFANPDYAKRAT